MTGHSVPPQFEAAEREGPLGSGSATMVSETGGWIEFGAHAVDRAIGGSATGGGMGDDGGGFEPRARVNGAKPAAGGNGAKLAAGGESAKPVAGSDGAKPFGDGERRALESLAEERRQDDGGSKEAPGAGAQETPGVSTLQAPGINALLARAGSPQSAGVHPTPAAGSGPAPLAEKENGTEGEEGMEQGGQEGGQGMEPRKEEMEPGEEGMEEGKEGEQGMEGVEQGTVGIEPRKEEMEPGEEGMEHDKEGEEQGTERIEQGKDGVEKGTEGAVPPWSVALPLAVGTKLRCQWRDDKYHPVKVIERRPLSGGGGECEYYVHYTEWNRRLDEWVRLEQLDLASVQSLGDQDRGDKGGSHKMTRQQKRRFDEAVYEGEGHEDLDAASLREHEEVTKVKNVNKIQLGRHFVDTWYFSPVPPEFSGVDTLYFCEFCLSFFKTERQLHRHMNKCDIRHPPGNEIYRSGSLSMFEVDGRVHRIYCQNLSYLAKLFLDHKTLLFDVDLFLFYVLCDCDHIGCHIVAYFSKEKHSEEGFNLACILTLPPHQRRGYGKFLIAFSYELSKKEGKVGTPERPLSDLGALSYRGYWTRVLLEYMRVYKNVTIKELSERTAIKQDDIISTLQALDLVQYRKGQHVLNPDSKSVERHLKEVGQSGLTVDPSKMQWTPYKEPPTT